MYMLSRILFLPMNYLEVFLAFKLGIFLLVLYCWFISWFYGG